MVSAFIKGVGLGIVEGAAEVIESDFERMKKTQDALINHHLKKGIAEQERHEKQQAEVSESIDLLKSITGEQDSDKAYQYAAQLFNSVGRDVTQAKELFNTVKKAQAMNPNYNVSEAFEFIDPGQDLKTKKEILESFATGSRGAYNPTITSVEVPGILGAFIKEKDISKQVKSNLSSLGISTQVDRSMGNPIPQIEIDRAYLDPVAALDYENAGVRVNQAKESLKQTRQQIKMNDIILKNMPEKTRQEMIRLGAQVELAIANKEAAKFNNILNKKFSYKEREQGLALINAKIKSAGPKDLEEYSVQLMNEMDSLRKQLAETTNNPTERSIVEQNLFILNKSLIDVSDSMDKESKRKIFSKINPETAYKGIYARTLSSYGIGYKTSFGIQGQVTIMEDGNAKEVYLARLAAAESFKKIYGPSAMSNEHFKNAQENLNTILTKGLANEIANAPKGVLEKAPTNINSKTRFDLVAGKIYDISESTFENQSMVNYLAKFGFTAAQGKYAVWTGDNFKALK